MPFSATPTLKLNLGDSIDDIEHKSTYRFSSEHQKLDIDLYVVNTPVLVTIDNPNCRVTLPEGTYAALDVNYGKLINFDISPHLKYVSLDQAFELNKQIIHLVQEAGWKRADNLTSNTEEDARRHFLSKEATEGIKFDLSNWTCGVQALWTQMQLQHRAGDSHSQLTERNYDTYIVTVTVSNKD